MSVNLSVLWVYECVYECESECVCVYYDTHVEIQMTCGFQFSFHYVGPRNWIQVLGLGGKHF